MAAVDPIAADSRPRPARGLVIGKFMPPTRGHQHLVDVARATCRRVTVLVCSVSAEPIDGRLRHAWMRELFPDLDVIHIDDDANPADPQDHPDFWAIWLGIIGRACPEPIDVVFTSEDYGAELARRVGARHVCVDRPRALVPVTATAVRADPLAHWDLLPTPVRAHYCRRVVVFGPESTGKSTLAARLAAHYRTAWVPERARVVLAPKNGRCDAEDIPLIAEGQAAAEDALVRQAERVLICDTDLLTTTIWSDLYFGSCPEWIRAEAARRRYDLHLLCDIDVPWVDDGQRDLGHRREEFFALCRAALERSGRPYVVISGGWDQRFASACAAIDAVIAAETPHHTLGEDLAARKPR